MKRIHSFEFEDLKWFPQLLRDYMTDYLQFSANTLDIYKSIVPIIQRGIDAAGNNTIIDIASGGTVNNKIQTIIYKSAKIYSLRSKS